MNPNDQDPTVDSPTPPAEDEVLVVESSGEDNSGVELLEELAHAGDAPLKSGLEGELERARAELAEAKERWLRALADHENLKKRMARERANERHMAVAGILRELLPALDGFDMAIKVAGEGTEIRSGLDLVAKQFRDALAQAGVREVPGVGEAFDPAHHEAVAREERAGIPHNQVAEVFRKGYLLGDRLIRPAMVKVAVAVERTEPEAAAPPAPEEPAS